MKSYKPPQVQTLRQRHVEERRKVRYGWTWRKIRDEYISRHPLCVICSAHGVIEKATDVDHIVPLEQGGTNDEANLQALCHKCHSRKTHDEVFGKGRE